jgi:rhamnose transport system ATP-binding protein
LKVVVPLLQLSNVSKSFEAVQALRNVNFDLCAGEVHALVGENGAGKSTLIKIITGAVQPDRGTIEMPGHANGRLTPASALRAGIAAIYQQPALFPDLTVAENMSLRLDKPSAGRRVRSKPDRVRARELLRQVGAQIEPTAEIRGLSMPQQQLVEIACAIGSRARILIMDEPTASLPSREVDLLLGLVNSLRSQGVGIIYISHRLDEIFRVANRVTVLRDGQTVATKPIAQVTETELIRMMIGREVSTIFPPPESAPGRSLLSLQNLGCRTAGVHNVNLEVRAGEILGLAGLVGAGRTELARVLFGITPADAGAITLTGKLVRINSPREAIEAGIGYVPEDRRRHGVILPMSLAANITMAVHERIFPSRWLRFKTERFQAQRWIQDLGIKTSSAEVPAASLSGGNQQKVALARWLAADPKVLILDEPTQGIDVAAKAEIHKLIRRLTAQGLAVLMISSELPEILGMSDRIAVMRDRTIVKVVDGKTATAHDVMTAAVGSTEVQ